MSALVVLGTRPEAIKLAPVIEGLRAAGVPTTVCATGQHPVLATDALAVFGITPERRLQPSNLIPPGGLRPSSTADLTGLLAAIALGVRDVISEVKPRIVVVHGDTTSAVAGGLAALYSAIPIAHVEAGLRTGERSGPFPEEANRRILDSISTLFLAPTQTAADRLLQEGRDPARVHVTGNTVVDALRRIAKEVARRAPSALPELAPLDLEDPTPVVLVTAHRRESHGAGLERICDAVDALDRVRIVWPLHPHPDVAGPVRRRLGANPRVSLIGALSYPAFVRLLLRADLVMTDSGGVQEETSILGRPTLVLRDETERPEILGSGVVQMVGTDPAVIVGAASAWLERPPTAVMDDSPLGDGTSGLRIGRIIREWLG